MATDGVKIIDGDMAFDIYSTFFEKYNNGVTVEELKHIYETDRKGWMSFPIDYEICVTAYALAFWEIGELTDEILTEVKSVIDRKAGVTDWAEQCGIVAGKARQKELEKFLIKISQPKTRAKKRTLPAKPKIGEVDQQIIEEAEKYRVLGEFDKTKTLYKKLLAEKPDLHDVRLKYLKLLCYIPQTQITANKSRVDEIYNMAIMEDCFTAIVYSASLNATHFEIIKTHTDWAEIEEQCQYMIAHRDVDKMEVSTRRKNKILDCWYLSVHLRLFSALMAQGKYAEAIKVKEDFVQFDYSRNKEFSMISSDFGDIYQCYLLLCNDEETQKFREKCEAEWTRDKIDVGGWYWDREFIYWEENLTKNGIYLSL